MSVDFDPSNPPYPKLPLWRTISLSYSTYFQYFIDALRASWLWLIVVAAITGILSWSQWSWMSTVMAATKPGSPPPFPEHTPHPPGITALVGLEDIVLTLAGVSIAVAWHRLLILGEHPGFSGSNVATKSLWRYIGIGLAIALIVVLPIIAIIFPTFYFVVSAQHPMPGPPRAALTLLILVLFVIYLVATAVMLRLTLLLPARAAGNVSLTFRQTWNRTRGNTWRLFWGILATTLPPLVLPIFLMRIGAPNVAVNGGSDFVRQMTATSMFWVIYYLLMLPIGIGFLSHAYRHFFRTESGPALSP